MEIIKFSHFNFILFPILVLSRLMDSVFKHETPTGYNTPNKFLNTLLYSIFSMESYLTDIKHIPFGGSAIVIFKDNGHD